MGTIDYTRRSAGLSNLRGATPRQIADTSVEWRGLGDIGRALAGIGKSGSDFAIALAAEDTRRREEATRAGLYANLVSVKTDILQNGYKDFNTGEEKSGLMTRELNAADGVRDEFKKAWGDFTQKLIMGTEYSDDTRAWLQSTIDRMAAETDASLGVYAAGERKKYEIGELKSGMEALKEEAVAKDWSDESVAALGSAVTSYYSRLYGGDSMRANEEAVKQMSAYTEEYVKTKIDTADEDDQIDKVMELMDSSDIDELTKDQLRERAETRRLGLEARRERERTAMITQSRLEGMQRELEFVKSGEVRPEEVVKFYQDQAKLAEQAGDVQGALKYRDEIKSYLVAQKRAEKQQLAEERDANKTALRLGLIEIALKSEHNREVSYDQIYLYRDFQRKLAAGAIDVEYVEKFQKDLKALNNKDRAWAVSAFAHAFGIKPGLDSGELSAAQRTAAATGKKLKDNGLSELPDGISSKEFIEMYDDFSAALDALGSDINRRDLTLKILGDFKSDWAAKKISEDMRKGYFSGAVFKLQNTLRGAQDEYEAFQKGKGKTDTKTSSAKIQGMRFEKAITPAVDKILERNFN